MNLLNDHIYGPALVLQACEAIEGGEAKCVTLVVAKPPGVENKIYLELSIFTKWIDGQAVWFAAWKFINHLEVALLLPVSGGMPIVCGWETDNLTYVAPTAALRLMSRLAVIEQATGGSIYLKSYSDEVPDITDGTAGREFS